MEFIKKIIKRNYPVITILGFVLFLFITNYRPGTWLTGWDNLHPEFNFDLNIKRSVFAVWQEYQGLGLLGGMAHSSDLLRQLTLALLSILLPPNILRYIYVFSALFIGATGAYKLILYMHKDGNESKLLALTGGLFYLLNLATVQQFYAPFEAFTAHFAALPWLLYASIKFFNIPSRKNLFFLALVLLLSTPAAYIPTLFLVYVLALSILVGFSFLQKPTAKKLIIGVKLYSVIILINSFWLFPFLYFTTTNVSVNINSKINQMATETIYLQNKEFGTLQDVMILKGFWFNNINPNLQNIVTHMFIPWREWDGHIAVLAIGYFLFLIIGLGLFYGIKQKKRDLFPFLLLFIFSFGVLAIDTFPFSILNSLVRNNIKILDQAFRFPFTKFSNLSSLCYAIFFTFGLKQIIIWLSKFIKNKKIQFIFVPQITILISIILLITFVFPAFSGNLFYKNEQIPIPKEYFQVFDFFKNQDPNTRIANFPQHTFWGWEFYKWGYGGSGFLWYGIKQPIIDRAFDVWSQYDENYSYEISNATYRKDTFLFEKVLNKYQATWIFIDKNIFETSSTKNLFIPELESMLDNSPNAKKVATFGKLEVYKFNLTNKPKNFVFLEKNLPVVNKYNWDNDDQAYNELGNYISVNNQLEIRNLKLEIRNSVTYPFRSLFSLKSQKEKEFNLTEKESTIELSTLLPANFKGTLSIPSFTEKEKLIPVAINSHLSPNGKLQLSMEVILPEVLVGQKKLTVPHGPTYQIQLPNIASDQYPLRLNINGADFKIVESGNVKIGTAFFTAESSNILTISDKNKKPVTEIAFPPEVISTIQTPKQSISVDEKSQILKIIFPKIDASVASFHPSMEIASKIENCDDFRNNNFSGKFTNEKYLTLNSTDATACIALFAQNLSHDQGYAIFIKNQYVTGEPLRFWVENTDQKSIPIDTYLSKEPKQITNSFILPPMESFGTSYAFHFYDSSIGRDKTINELSGLSVYPIFYDYLKSIRVDSGNTASGQSVNIENVTVEHPNESLYLVDLSSLTSHLSPQTLILSQSFNPGWKAYAISNLKCQISNFKCTIAQAFPFIFGKEIKNHVEVNNWENGWTLDESQLPSLSEVEGQIVIVYLPQYLEYLGFILLVGTFLLVPLSKWKNKSK